MIVLVVGDFCVGKDTFADMLIAELKKCDTFETKKILSYTTREPRDKEENTHEFCTREEFLEFDDLVAQTKIGDEYYGARACQFEREDVNVYVVDSKGAADVLAYGLDIVYIIEVVRPKWLIRCPESRQNRLRHNTGDYYVDYRVLNDSTIGKLTGDARQCAINIMDIFISD